MHESKAPLVGAFAASGHTSRATPRTTARSVRTMLRHVVLLKFTEQTSDEEIEDIAAALRELPGHLPAIRSYIVGRNLGISEGAADLAIFGEFDDVAGYETYRDDPEHQAIIASRIRPKLESRLATQVEI